MGRKSEPRECKCGCGEYTRGGLFCMGHNARYESAERALTQHAAEIVAYFVKRARPFDQSDYEWLFRAARRNGDYTGDSPMQAGRALSVYFTERPGHRAKDGWTITTDPAVMYATILRQCS